MDFITGLPTVDGKASILVIIDRFSKYGVFIVAIGPCSAKTVAELFF